MNLRHLALKASAVALAACSVQVEEPSPNVDDAAQELISGTTTCGYSWVGKLWAPDGTTCTATLVAPDMVLTAGHCVGYGRSESGATTSYLFLINDYGASCGATTLRAVKRFYSFGNVLGADDVAIAQLSAPIETAVAAPMKLAPSLPPSGTNATIVGHGARYYATAPSACGTTDFMKAFAINSIDGTVSGNTKTFSAPYTGSGCPGDSGAPVFTGASGIFWTRSFSNLSGSNVVGNFGEVWRWRGSIDAKMAEWTCPSGVYFNGSIVDKDDRYPFARVCGRNGQNYECYHPTRSWRAVGASGVCGSTACRCGGGTAFGGVAIDPWKTSCGSTVCGTDQYVYECTSSGWRPITTQRCGT